MRTGPRVTRSLPPAARPSNHPGRREPAGVPVISKANLTRTRDASGRRPLATARTDAGCAAAGATPRYLIRNLRLVI